MRIIKSGMQLIKRIQSECSKMPKAERSSSIFKQEKKRNWTENGKRRITEIKIKKSKRVIN